MILLALFFSASAFALSESDVVKSVLTHYPSILASQDKVEASEGFETAAKGEFDHKLKHNTKLWRQYPYNNEYYETFLERQTPYGGAKLMAGHRQGAGEFNYYDLKNKTSTAGQIFAGIVLPILRDFQTDEFRSNLKVAELEKERAKQELRVKKLASVHKALSVYYKWALECRKLAINRAILDLALQRREMLTKKYKAGDSDRMKVIDNDRQINKRESEFLKSTVEERKAALELSLYLRDKDGKPIVPEPLPNAETILEQDTFLVEKKDKELPQTRILSIEQEIQKIYHDLSDQSQLPGLNVGVLGGRELSDRPGYGKDILEVGIKFDFPLENRKAEGKTVAYHYKKMAVEKELLLMSQQLEQMLKAAELSALNAKDRYKTTGVEYENSEKVAKGERRKWELGASDLFVVNLREQDLADVDIRRWSALFDYHQARLDAGLFSGTLPTEL